MSFEPQGYVSFDTALSAHGILDDLVHVIRIATAGSDRSMLVPELGLVEWISIPEAFLFGDREGSAFDFPGMRVAEPEKALCDLLFLSETRGFAPPVHALRLDDLDTVKLRRYAHVMDLDLTVLRPGA